MDYKKSMEDFKKILDELREENKKAPIIVEGEKDVEALRKLDIKGEITQVNSGRSLIDFCDFIASKYTDVIILTDWDRKGGYLCHTIVKNLQGRVNCNMYFREFIAKNATIKTLEGLPSWIVTINEKLMIR